MVCQEASIDCCVYKHKGPICVFTRKKHGNWSIYSVSEADALPVQHGNIAMEMAQTLNKQQMKWVSHEFHRIEFVRAILL